MRSIYPFINGILHSIYIYICESTYFWLRAYTNYTSLLLSFGWFQSVCMSVCARDIRAECAMCVHLVYSSDFLSNKVTSFGSFRGIRLTRSSSWCTATTQHTSKRNGKQRKTKPNELKAEKRDLCGEGVLDLSRHIHSTCIILYSVRRRPNTVNMV